MYTGFLSTADEVSKAAVFSWKAGYERLRLKDRAVIDAVANAVKLGKPPILTLESEELIITAPGTIATRYLQGGRYLIHGEFSSPVTHYGISIDSDGETYVTIQTVRF